MVPPGRRSDSPALGEMLQQQKQERDNRRPE
jgi:hypothetical protein